MSLPIEISAYSIYYLTKVARPAILRLLGVILLIGSSLCASPASPSIPPRPDGGSVYYDSEAIQADAILEMDGSLTLRGAIRRALQKSPELSSTAWNADSAFARIRQARLWPNPEIEFERENFGGTGSFSGSDQAEDQLSLSQMLPLGGDLKNRRRLAEAEYDQAAWDYHATRLGVILETTHRFIEVLAAEWGLELAHRQLALARELESITDKRVQAGEASPVDRSRVKVPLVLAEIEKDRAELARSAVRQRLALMWGDRQLGDVRLTGDLQEIAKLPEPEELVTFVNTTPAVGRWASEISARKAEFRLARAGNIPNPVFQLGVKRVQDADGHGLIVGISLPLPLFDRNQGIMASARAAERAAHDGKRAAELRIESELSLLYFTLAVSHTEANALGDRAVPAARNAYEATLRAFREGELPYLDVLEASRSLLELEEKHLASLVSYHMASAELTALLGGHLPNANL